MKKIIFQAIAGYLYQEMNLPAMVNKYGPLLYIARYNTQFEQASLEGVISFPAVGISFETDWTDNTNNQQMGQMIVTLYIAYATIADPNYLAESNAEALKRDEYVQDIHLLLQGKDFGAAGTMRRVRELEDINHDHISIDPVQYTMMVDDSLADPSLNLVEITPDWKIIYKNPTDRPAPPPNDGGYIIPNVS